MKRLTSKQTREMIENGLIREISHVSLEAPGHVYNIKGCEKTAEALTDNSLRELADFCRISNYLNITRRVTSPGEQPRSNQVHRLSIFYYEKLKGGEK